MIKVGLLHYQLAQAGLPVVGVSADGRVDYSRALVPAEEAIAAQVIAAHDPNGLLPEEQNAQDYRQARQAALTLLNSGIDSWPTMTAAQKNAWVGANMDAVLKILRALIKITT